MERPIYGGQVNPRRKGDRTSSEKKKPEVGTVRVATQLEQGSWGDEVIKEELSVDRVWVACWGPV